MTAIQIEGNLIAPDMPAELLAGNIKGQAPEDFGLKKTDKLADEIATAWGDAKAYWAAFQRGLARLGTEDPATTITREQWVMPLLRSFGYNPVYTAKAEIVENQTYAISHRAEMGENPPPIHIIGSRVKLDKRPPSGIPRLSAHALIQEYLNRTEHLWGIVTNGLQWRLLRDSSLMTRLTYIEFDLEQILNGENFAEFGLFYRLFHRSRLPLGMEDADKCLLEFYHQEALQQGGRVRDRLRDGVEKALLELGNGFLQHPSNEILRNKVSPGAAKTLTAPDFYRQLLLLVYRLLFLMVAESRNLLLAREDEEKARIYLEYYSIDRLRLLAESPITRREGFGDLWQGLRVTFALFDQNWRGQFLGLSPLNGDLFGSGTLADLNDCAIENHHLLQAIRYLSLYEQNRQLRRVNYAALDVEELGSVYESLLDFAPQIQPHQGIYQFVLITGSDRKTTGSYYTPPELVGQLIKSALEPVIEAKLRSSVGATASAPKSDGETENLVRGCFALTEEPGDQGTKAAEEALLSLKICDPACGSGHFLLAAARRIGKELARVRTGEAQPGPEPLRQAIRDVIQHCIYGVDLNPLAVDLCKVALWIEGFCRGLPLNFLDHRIKCGNSLVGVFDLEVLHEGIPDDAFKAVTGDDKKLATQLKKENKKQRKDQQSGQLTINSLEPSRDAYVALWQRLEQIPENTTEGYRQKANKYQENRADAGWWRDYSACNLWTAAFFTPLTEQHLQLLPTTAALSRLLLENSVTQQVVTAANQLGTVKRFFHWPLEFPEVFQAGGFDCLLGNPPWERIKLQEKEFFAARSAEIVNAANKAAREKLIKQLPKTNPELAQAWEDAQHDAEAQSKFIRESGRFPLTAVGDINTYAVFTETARKLISSGGRAGVIVPTGIATDDTCKKFFGDLITTGSLAKLIGFENEAFIFSTVHHAFKFCILVLTEHNHIGDSRIKIQSPEFTFFCRYFADINNYERQFTLTSKEIALINPNTLTCPVFRTRTDAELTKKIYQRVPVLENERTGVNPWGISFMRMFDMANDSGLFQHEAGYGLVPLYEAKMFHQFDHRFSTYADATQAQLNAGILPKAPEETKQNPDYGITPRYWVSRTEVENRLGGKWDKEWLLAFRDITNATSERTAIFSILPKIGVGNNAPIILINPTYAKLAGCFLGNFCSLIFDFVTRHKVGGNHINFFILKQLPVLPPEAYTPEDINFIAPRVIELVYTAWDIKPFAEDMWRGSQKPQNSPSILTTTTDSEQLRLNLNLSEPQPEPPTPAESSQNQIQLRRLILEQWQSNQQASPITDPPPPIGPLDPETDILPIPPFIWNSDRRAVLRAELDAYYGKLYGITRDELRYILDPADVHGPDFPSETFRVLKNNETKEFGEYRTQRLVLAAWDRMFGGG